MAARIVGAVALVLFALGPGLAALRLIPALFGFGLFVLSGLLGTVAVVWGLLGQSWLAALLGAAPAALLLLQVVLALVRGAPRINDVATSADDPPRFDALADTPYRPEVAAIVARAYPNVEPLVVDADVQTVRNAAIELARSRSRWTIVEVSDDGFEATSQTAIFGFIDDVSLRVRPDDGGSIVDMRSRSRDGQGDFGVNAARIESFLSDLEAKLAGASAAPAAPDALEGP